VNPKGTPRNLKPFPRGVSGNPGGRPKKRPISDRYAELTEVLLPERDRIKHGLPKGATYGDALALSVFKAALKGRTDAAREIREAIEGKAPQRIEAGPGSQEVTLRVHYEQEKRDRSVRETEQVDDLAKGQPTAGKPACRTDVIEPT